MRRLVLGAALLLAGCGGGDDGGSAPRTGEQVFAGEDCGSCHTLAAAGASGTVGPSLDGAGLKATEIERWVREGGSGMPAYEGRIDAAEITAVAGYVERSAGR